MEQMKIDLANAMCNALNNGIVEYFDSCHWLEKEQVYDYYCSNEGSHIYLTIDEMVELLDKEFKEERVEIIEDYFA